MRARRALSARLWHKLLFAYLVPTAFLFMAIAWVAHQAAKNALDHQLGQRLIQAAQTAAWLVGRPRAVALQAGDEQTRTYKNLQTKLADFQQLLGLERIVLFRNDQRVLLDSSGKYTIGEPMPSLAAVRAELEQVRMGQASASYLYAGSDGRYYKTGFAPVVIDGAVEAMVGADGSARFFGPLGQLRSTLIGFGALALILVVVITLLVSRGITLPLDRLARLAKAIGQGQLHQQIQIETSDEIGVLAKTLRDMQDRIGKRDQQLQMMLAGIAHEVRNPLGGMALFVGLLQEELRNNPAAKEHLDRIERELGYLNRVVNDFLDFARKKPLQVSLVDPRLEFEQIQALCIGRAQQAQVKLSFQVDDDVKQVRWDTERVRQVLLNLINNALSACQATDSIRCRLSRHGDRQVALVVEDTGPGVPQEVQEQIFEPFFTTRQQGTGLGLALVKKIVESHGGMLELESNADVTRFVILLPAL